MKKYLEVENLEGRNRADITAEKIKAGIEGLLCEKFSVPENFALRDNDAFFGLQALLEPRELTYVAYMLEAQYGIQFNKKQYDDPRFYTVSGLSEVVAEMLPENYGVAP